MSGIKRSLYMSSSGMLFIRLILILIILTCSLLSSRGLLFVCLGLVPIKLKHLQINLFPNKLQQVLAPWMQVCLPLPVHTRKTILSSA